MARCSRLLRLSPLFRIPAGHHAYTHITIDKVHLFYGAGHTVAAGTPLPWVGWQ